MHPLLPEDKLFLGVVCSSAGQAMMYPDGRHRRLITGSKLSRSLVLETVENKVTETEVEHLP